MSPNKTKSRIYGNIFLMNQIADLKSYAEKNDVPIMKDETQTFICDYIRAHRCTRILEIGSAIGYSSIQFALVSEDVRVTTIEIDIDRYIRAVQNIKDFNLQDRITIYNQDALWMEMTGEFDLIFIDAAKAQYIKFFEKYKNNLAPNGVIISDNLSFHGMVEDISLTHNYSTKKLVKKIRKYVDFLKNNTDFQTTFYETGDGISVTKRANP